ncbi:MAG: PSD1 domain-containing protein [Planctomycetes bacterium]|nr:PSD1 domain-containing protein [Planctomycetota bacterium]
MTWPAGLAAAPAPDEGRQKKPAIPAAPSPRFEADVLPIFRAHCARCHGVKPRKAGLNLSNREGVFEGSESGPVLVPGKVEESLLFKKVHEGKMPPDKKARLSDSEVETIRRWITAGAPSAATEKGTGRPSVTQLDIIPLMLLNCTTCHGGRRREAGLDLRTRAAMLQGGKSGPALVPGHPEQSLILKKIRAGKMPPFEQMMQVSVKPFSAGEIDRLLQWIALGAPEVRTEADVATADPDPAVSDKDRSFWSFRAPAPIAVPAVRNARRVRNPVDAFVQKKLEENGLTLGPATDRLTLMRRAYLDLTGLLPAPDDIQSFLTDGAPDAYERLIDRLLASPHYGERWSRHWLDLAGYSDSEGHFADSVRPFAYRFRDYVIRSFNADKPYDRFLIEQIAGDELVDYEHAPAITRDIMDNLVATGFLRLAPDGTNPPELNSVPERLDVIADELEIFSSAVLGLTLQCARCHDHKYDPIPQRDYYRLAAVFKGAFDEYDWLRPYERGLSHITAEENQKMHAHNRPLSIKIHALQAELDQVAGPLRQKLREEALAKLPEVLRDDLRRMLATPPAKRDVVQKYLAEQFEKELRYDVSALIGRSDEFRKAFEENSRKMEPFQNQLLTGSPLLALWDRGDPSPTYIYRKGDPQKPGRMVGPGVPSVLTDGRTPFVVKLPWPGAKKTGRRLALAQWLVRPDHPLTARVMVNRIWKHHFGQGLVSTLDNFGHTGTRPTHPELLDWLAREFIRGASGGCQPPGAWSMKAMHRLLMTSAVYRQSSPRTPDLEKRDPENRLLGRMPLQRMQAEVLYDALLQVGDRLDPRLFDPPAPVEVRPDGLVTPMGTERGWRRSVYVLQRRKEVPTLLESFDFPQMTPNCIKRTHTTVASQALNMMNDALVQQLAGAFARRVAREAGADPTRRIERAYWIALSRPPTTEERIVGLRALAELTRSWAKQGRPGEEVPADRALATFCHALLNSAAFVTID